LTQRDDLCIAHGFVRTFLRPSIATHKRDRDIMMNAEYPFQAG